MTRIFTSTGLTGDRNPTTKKRNPQDGSLTDTEAFTDADRAAEFLCVTRRRVLEMARSGEIPAHPIGRTRKTWHFRLSELAGAIAGQGQENGARKRGIMYSGGSLAVPEGKGL